MRQNIKERLVNWKNDCRAGESKRVILSVSPRQDGEFIIQLEKVLHASLGETMINVVVNKKYVTTAQANSLRDPAADLYQLEAMIDLLDREFADRYDAKFNKAFNALPVHAD